MRPSIFFPFTSNQTISTTQNPTTKSFVQALTNVCDIPLSQLPQSCVKGDRITITIPEEEYLTGLEACKNNLHDRILWPKGTMPLKIDALHAKLITIWRSIRKWRVTSLGKGFYEFLFSLVEDMLIIRSLGAINMAPGTLKLFFCRVISIRACNKTTTHVWYGFSVWLKNIGGRKFCYLSHGAYELIFSLMKQKNRGSIETMDTLLESLLKWAWNMIWYAKFLLKELVLISLWM